MALDNRTPRADSPRMHRRLLTLSLRAQRRSYVTAAWWLYLAAVGTWLAVLIL
jgi:hypothetical protein